MVNYPTLKGNHIPHMGDVVPHSVIEAGAAVCVGGASPLKP